MRQKGGGVVQEIGYCQSKGGEVREKWWHCGVSVNGPVIDLFCTETLCLDREDTGKGGQRGDVSKPQSKTRFNAGQVQVAA